jgi:uncharacterized membrane-anchored protein
MHKRLYAVLFCLALAATAAARDDTGVHQKGTGEAQSVLYTPQQGKIVLPGGIATLDLPPNFRYLDAADAAHLLEAWGNPPGARTLGMLVPAGVNPMSAGSWGVVITYEKDGHVKDADADGIDYTRLLKDMQDGLEQSNAERRKQGYPAMTLLGWAERPHYDKASHKLYWAKELQSEGEAQHGLNYHIRVLGREGVLVLNAVAGIGQLDQIRAEMRQVTSFTNFTTGNRYADFNGRTDKVAGYGIAALVAGIAAAGSFAWKFFKRTPKNTPETEKADKVTKIQ